MKSSKPSVPPPRAHRNSLREWVGLSVLLVLVGLGLLGWSTGALNETASTIIAHRHVADRFAETWPTLAVLLYVVLFAVLTGCCLPVALALTFVSGALFGPILGGGATVIGATLGATLTYLATRSTLGYWVTRHVGRRPRAEQLVDRMRSDPFPVILSARLMPMFPFAALNVAAGLASIPVRPYVLATLLASMPTSFLYASIGSGLDEALSQEGATSQSVMASPAVGWPLLGLMVLAATPLLVSFALRRLRAERGGPA